MAVAFTEEKPVSQDGTQLYVQRWAPAERAAIADLLVLHGYAEHGGRYRELGHALAGRGIAVSALDVRGHGKAEGPRGFVTAFERYYDDLEAGLSTLTGKVPRFILGHSHGGLIALDWLGKNGPRVAELRGAVITNPYLAVAIEVPGYKRLLAGAMATLYPRLSLPSGIPTTGLSRAPGVREAYERDPLVFSIATAGWFAESNRAQERVRALRALPLPLLYVYSDADPITAWRASEALAAQLAGDKTVIVRPGELHEVLNEIGREELFGKVADWILARV